jgi:hypothetical protein
VWTGAHAGSVDSVGVRQLDQDVAWTRGVGQCGVKATRRGDGNTRCRWHRVGSTGQLVGQSR